MVNLSTVAIQFLNEAMMSHGVHEENAFQLLLHLLLIAGSADEFIRQQFVRGRSLFFVHLVCSVDEVLMENRS